MTEVPDPRYEHGPLGSIDGRDSVGIAQRAAGLDERRDSGVEAHLHGIGEWVEGIGRTGRALERLRTGMSPRLVDRTPGSVNP